MGKNQTRQDVGPIAGTSRLDERVSHQRCQGVRSDVEALAGRAIFMTTLRDFRCCLKSNDKVF